MPSSSAARASRLPWGMLTKRAFCFCESRSCAAALGVALGQSGDSDHLIAGPAAARDGGAQVVQPVDLLAGAQVVGVQRAARINDRLVVLQGEAQISLQFVSEEPPALFGDEELEPGVAAFVAEHVAVAENQGRGAEDGRDKVGNAILGDEDAQALGKIRIGGEAASHDQPQAPLLAGRSFADDSKGPKVVDLRLVAVKRAGGNGGLELAREVGELLAAGAVHVGHALNSVAERDDLAVQHAIERAGGGVAGVIAAGEVGIEAGLVDAVEGVGEVRDAHPVELDVLPGGDVAESAAVVVGQSADLAKLSGCQPPAGQFDAPHEVAVVGFLPVDAVPAHAEQVIFGNGGVASLCVPEDVVPDAQGIPFVLDLLDLRHGRVIAHSSAPV